MATYLEGHLQGAGRKIAIAISRFNSFISEKLLEGAIDTLVRSGVNTDDIVVAYPSVDAAALRRLADSPAAASAITLSSALSSTVNKGRVIDVTSRVTGARDGVGRRGSGSSGTLGPLSSSSAGMWPALGGGGAAVKSARDRPAPGVDLREPTAPPRCLPLDGHQRYPPPRD